MNLLYWRMKTYLLVILLILAPQILSACRPGQLMEGLDDVGRQTSALGDEKSAEEEKFQLLRLDMVAKQIEGRGISDSQVLDAMRTVPRHQFVPREYLASAYNDHPLPIGYGQTISQPYIVGLMSEALQLDMGEKVLEIGTGSAYQAAVLAEMGMEVYTIEIITELADEAKQKLSALDYRQVAVLNADGYFGWVEHAPFDAIIVTAAPDHLPQPLVEQLNPGGRLVLPIGPVGATQTLWVFDKDLNGELQASNLGAVRFVPLTRQE